MVRFLYGDASGVRTEDRMLDESSCNLFMRMLLRAHSHHLEFFPRSRSFSQVTQKDFCATQKILGTGGEFSFAMSGGAPIEIEIQILQSEGVCGRQLRGVWAMHRMGWNCDWDRKRILPLSLTVNWR